MNTRERLLVFAMIAAVAVGGYLSLSRAGRDSAEPDDMEAGVSDAEGFARRIRADLQPYRLTSHEESILNAAAGDWAPSPFLEKPDAAVVADTPAAEIIYTGFVNFGGTRLAILNGREYRLSESVTATDFIVESIEPDRVGLAAKNGGRRATIILKGSDSRRELP